MKYVSEFVLYLSVYKCGVNFVSAFLFYIIIKRKKKLYAYLRSDLHKFQFYVNFS